VCVRASGCAVWCCTAPPAHALPCSGEPCTPRAGSRPWAARCRQAEACTLRTSTHCGQARVADEHAARCRQAEAWTRTLMPLTCTHRHPLTHAHAHEHACAHAHMQCDAIQCNAQPRQPLPAPTAIDYELVVYTGDKRGAGTDATVTAEIVGSLYTAQHTFDQVRQAWLRVHTRRTRPGSAMEHGPQLAQRHKRCAEARCAPLSPQQPYAPYTPRLTAIRLVGGPASQLWWRTAWCCCCSCFHVARTFDQLGGPARQPWL